MKGSLAIASQLVGPTHPVFVIAEMSANHGGDIEHAKKVIRAAKASGADAIKLQTYTADTMTVDSDAPPFQIKRGAWAGRVLHELYSEACMPWDWQPELKQLADEIGIILFSTPFDLSAVEFLESIDVPAYKIASFELVDLPLIEAVARTGKPIILSTGMATEEEIVEAVETVRSTSPDAQLALLRCTSAYPAHPEGMDLKTIPDMQERFGVPVGLSDHTMGTSVSVVAVSLGACIVEKHFCLSRDEGGADSHFSLEPAELRQLVSDVRTAEMALGSVRYGPGNEDMESLRFRRSLFVVESLAEGEILSEGNVRSLRPSDGLAPKHLREVLGRRISRSVERGTPLSWDLLTPK